MDQLKQLIAGLTLKQRVTIVLLAGAMVTALVLLTRWSRERDFRPLFSGLSAEDAGAA